MSDFKNAILCHVVNFSPELLVTALELSKASLVLIYFSFKASAMNIFKFCIFIIISVTLSNADDRTPHPAYSRRVQKINPSENLSSRRAPRNCAELRLYPEWCYHKNALFDSINCECEYCALTQVVDFEGKTCLCNVTIC